MAPGKSRSIFPSVLIFLLLTGLMVSCVKLRGPGIMPPVNEDGYNQWEVVSSGFMKVATYTDGNRSHWQVIARFIPASDIDGLNSQDLVAAMDGVAVPFTFDEASQIFKSITAISSGTGRHRLEITPSDNASYPFPSLTVYIETP